MTGKNPLEVNLIIFLYNFFNFLKVLINAVMNGGAREDSTRIGAGGVVRK